MKYGTERQQVIQDGPNLDLIEKIEMYFLCLNAHAMAHASTIYDKQHASDKVYG